MATNVSVVGLGKLGACMAATMAKKGMSVIGVDLNRRNVDLINEGKPPVVEPHLAETMTANAKRLRATTNFETAVLESEITFVIVPTPSDEHGAFSLDYAADAARQIGRALRRKSAYHLVVLTSTVLPGATEETFLPALEKESGKKCGRDFGLCYNPEFIALGSVIHDLLNPDFVLIGQFDDKSGATLEAWYKSFSDNTPPVARMSIVNAELTKIAVNTFVTTKITFANMLASICEGLPGADVDTVTTALGLDSRIGRRYLTGGTGYGGPCFPRDNRAFAYAAQKAGRGAALAEATDKVNRTLVAAQAERVCRSLRPGTTAAVLGLAYKPDTGILEESAAVALTRHLIGAGHRVVVFDPIAMDSARALFEESVEYAESPKDCIERAEAVVIVNPCKEFRSLEAKDFPKREPLISVLDGWRILREKLKACPWVNYIPLGVGPRSLAETR